MPPTGPGPGRLVVNSSKESREPGEIDSDNAGQRPERTGSEATERGPFSETFDRYFRTPSSEDQHATQTSFIRAETSATRANFRSTWSKRRRALAKVMEHAAAEIALALVVTMNAIFIIFETDQRASGADTPMYITIVSYVFLTLYGVDVSLRIYTYRAEYFTSFMNNLDFTVVFIDICLALLTSIVGDLPSMSLLRLARIFRLTRFMHVLAMFKELHMLVHGFVSAMRAIIWASFMLGTMLTVWSIIAVEVMNDKMQKLIEQGEDFGGCQRCARAFSSVMEANLTFIQQIVAGDSWGLVSVPLIESAPWTGFILIGALITVQLGMLNLILTVIVNAAQDAHDSDVQRGIREKAKDFEKSKKKLLRICRELDTDDNGEITLEELLDGIQENASFRETLAMMDVKEEDMSLIWQFLDKDGDGKLFYFEFVEQLYRLKSQDVKTHLIFLKGHLTAVQTQVAHELECLRYQVMPAIDGVLGGLIHISDAVVPREKKDSNISSWRTSMSRDIKARLQAIQDMKGMDPGHSTPSKKPPGLKEMLFPTVGGLPVTPGSSVTLRRLELDSIPGSPLAPETAGHNDASGSEGAGGFGSPSTAASSAAAAPARSEAEANLSQELANLRNRVENDLAAQLRESTKRAEENAHAQAVKLDALFKLVTQERSRSYSSGWCGIERKPAPETILPHMNYHVTPTAFRPGYSSPMQGPTS